MHLSHVKWLKTFNGRIYFRPVIFVSLQIELSGGSSSRRWFACLVVLNYFLLKFYHSFLSPACYLNFILLWNINFEPSFKYICFEYELISISSLIILVHFFNAIAWTRVSTRTNIYLLQCWWYSIHTSEWLKYLYIGP